MSRSKCRVWEIYQARCLLCGWSGETTSDQAEAADDAREHRLSDEHVSQLASRAAAHMRKVRANQAQADSG